MKEVINFIKAADVEKTNFFGQLKCSAEEAKILQYMSKEYVNGRDTLGVIDVLGEFYDLKTYKHLEKLDLSNNSITNLNDNADWSSFYHIQYLILTHQKHLELFIFREDLLMRQKKPSQKL